MIKLVLRLSYLLFSLVHSFFPILSDLELVLKITTISNFLVIISIIKKSQMHSQLCKGYIHYTIVYVCIYVCIYFYLHVLCLDKVFTYTSKIYAFTIYLRSKILFNFMRKRKLLLQIF